MGDIFGGDNYFLINQKLVKALANPVPLDDLGVPGMKKNSE
jgi:hypothetical protein